MEADRLFLSGDDRAIWQKYCSFLDLSLEEFMQIQEDLLMEQLKFIADTPIGKKFIGVAKPTSIEEFRQTVPFTRYDDYKDFLKDKKDDALPEKASAWVSTSGRTGDAKWVPHTERSLSNSVDYVIASFLLACTTKRGYVNVHPGYHFLYNVAPRPYLSGFMVNFVTERAQFKGIPPLDVFEKLSFRERSELSFKMALRSGIDVAASLASVLVKIGESIAKPSGSKKIPVSNPFVMLRLLRAFVRSKIAKREILPKDLWKLKGIIAMGTDTSIYRDKIKYYWGIDPTEFYASSEIGFIATQAWNRASMTFVPASAFFEFIPEEEWSKNKENPESIPKTVLINQLEPGKIYELVATTFYGVPFLRYRIGDLIKVVSMRDEEAGIDLPQIIFHSRADDILDIANFARLDERTVWTAINKADIKYEDWTIRKEYISGEIILHLYIEAKDKRSASEIRDLVHQQLKLCCEEYKSMAEMLEIDPLRVSLLSAGTFGKYMEEKQAAGADLGGLKPTHMNPSEKAMSDILRISQM